MMEILFCGRSKKNAYSMKFNKIKPVGFKIESIAEILVTL
jgi:hypothetical protein